MAMTAIIFVNNYKENNAMIYEYSVFYTADIDIAKVADKTRSALVRAGYKVVREKDRGAFRPAYPLDGHTRAHSYSFYLEQASFEKMTEEIESAKEVLRTLLTAVE